MHSPSEHTLFQRDFQKVRKVHVKSIVSAIALSAALTLSGSAFAQTMLNGAEVPADELPAVQERCDQLKLAADKDGATDSTQPAESDADETTSAADANTETDDAAAVSEAADALTTIDLETITLEACVEAGLVDAAM